MGNLWAIFVCTPNLAGNRPRREITMKYSRPVHVSTVALVSAALHAGLAVLFVPMLSFVFLLTAGGNVPTEASRSDEWMMLAVIAPVLCGVIGLLAGAVMASLFNLFVRQQVKAREASEGDPSFWASVSDAA
jgi:hypothetical protein